MPFATNDDEVLMMVKPQDLKPFKLDDEFIDIYKNKNPKHGMDILGLVTFYRTYSRPIEGLNRNEHWYETARRVVEGVMDIQYQYCMQHRRKWSDIKGQRIGQVLYDKLFNFKLSPPGRGLWMHGTKFIKERGGAALNNCAGISTENISNPNISSYPFVWAMDQLMLGAGVSSDTRGKNTLIIKQPSGNTKIYTIPDTREGWINSVWLLLESYFKGTNPYTFNYEMIRPSGLPIKGFGGTSSGPQPLILLHENIQKVLNSRIGSYLTSVDIVDIYNFIAKCVVAGNVRRCLPENAPIMLKNGIRQIKDVCVGDEVLTTQGYKRITKKMDQGIQKTIYIVTQCGDFECTPNHRMAVFDSYNTYKFKFAKDLMYNDRLVFVSKNIDGVKTHLPEYQYVKPPHSTTCKDIVIPELTTDVAWFFGYFHGDGHVRTRSDNKRFGGISLSCNLSHTNIIEKCVNIIKLFGINPWIQKTEGHWVNVHGVSYQLMDYFSQFKQSNTDITIPDFINNGTVEIRASYLAGLFDADGSCNTRPIQAVASVYENFTLQVSSLYASLGIPVRIKHKERREIKWKPINTIVFSTSKALTRFIQIISKYSLKFELNRTTKFIGYNQHDATFPKDFWHKSKDYKNSGMCDIHKTPGGRIPHATLERILDQELPLVPIRVRTVIQGREIQTYDIEVDDVHEFSCDGLLTHNSATLLLGDVDDTEFITMKDPLRHQEELLDRRWASNNSVFVRAGKTRYEDFKDSICSNGEPGFIWLENAQTHGRMIDLPDNKDKNVKIFNPCGEIPLESAGVCNLVTVYPSHHDTYDEFEESIKYAYMYAKTVTLLDTAWPETNNIVHESRRIGISVSGITDAFEKHGRNTTLNWFDNAYKYVQKLDIEYSKNWLHIPESRRLTTVKPEGTVSLLAGVSPGIHYPHDKYYIRRVRISANSPLCDILEKHGYHYEIERDNKAFEFPMMSEYFSKSKQTVSVEEQFQNAVDLQRIWSDNAVSITITFKHKIKRDGYGTPIDVNGNIITKDNPQPYVILESEIDEVIRCLYKYENQLKGVSLLPDDPFAYPLMPYESITKAKFDDMWSKITPIDFHDINLYQGPEKLERFCNSESCEFKQEVADIHDAQSEKSFIALNDPDV